MQSGTTPLMPTKSRCVQKKDCLGGQKRQNAKTAYESHDHDPASRLSIHRDVYLNSLGGGLMSAARKTVCASSTIFKYVGTRIDEEAIQCWPKWYKHHYTEPEDLLNCGRLIKAE